MKLIDSHVHFWNPAVLRYEWLDNEPFLNQPFLPSDFRATAESYEVSGLVFVQADCLPEQGVEEVKWVTELAAELPIRGIVAFAPMDKADAHVTLETLAAYPLVKGVRRLIQSEGAGFAAEPEFVRNVQSLSKFGFRFDLCVRYYQLPDVLKLVEQCPDVSFVLDHVGKPNIARGEITAWQEGIRQLAGYNNVWCKVSGMVTEANHNTWNIDDLRPYVECVLEAFGSHRVMFGSDWPVSTLASTYQRWVETLQTILSTVGTEDQQRIFYDNAQQFYRLEI